MLEELPKDLCKNTTDITEELYKQMTWVLF